MHCLSCPDYPLKKDLIIIHVHVHIYMYLHVEVKAYHTEIYKHYYPILYTTCIFTTIIISVNNHFDDIHKNF